MTSRETRSGAKLDSNVTAHGPARHPAGRETGTASRTIGAHGGVGAPDSSAQGSLKTAVPSLLWHVVQHTSGAIDSIELGDTPADPYRIGVTFVGNGDSDAEVSAQIIYPCRACGWKNACGVDGEDCHS